MDSKQTDKIWLIKAAGVVLGPLSEDELRDSLKRKTIGITDEARNMSSRWRFIREHPDLIGLVRDVRQEHSSGREETAPHSIDNRTITSTLETKLDEVTPHPEPKKPAMPGAVDIRAVERKFEPGAASTGSYGSLQDSKVQQRLSESRSSWKALTWSVAAIAIVASVYYFSQQEKKAQRSLTSADNIKLARQYRGLGFYDKALLFLKRADAITPLDFSNRIQLVELYLSQPDGKGEAAREIETLRQSKLSAPQEAVVNNLAGLLALQSGKYDEALGFFDRAASDSSIKKSAILNAGQALLLNRHPSEAFDKFSASEVRLEPMAVLGRAWSLIEMEDNSKKTAQLTDVDRDLQKVSNQGLEWRLEALFASVVVESILKSTEQMSNSAQMLLDENPDLSKDFARDLQITTEMVSWQRNLNRCVRFQTVEDPMYRGLAAFCYYVTGDLVRAHQVLDDTHKQYSTSPQILGLFAWLLMNEQRYSEARALATISATKDKVLGSLALAQTCLREKDFACAENHFGQILSSHPDYLPALAGMARIELERNHKESARRLVRKAMQITTKYRPTNEIRDEAENF